LRETTTSNFRRKKVRNLIKALCVAGMSLAMAAPAFGAAQLYGSFRYDTFYVIQKSDGAMNVAGDDSVTTLQNELPSNSRIGVKFDQGNLNGHFEMGVQGSNGGNSIYTRLMYGTYKFGSGTLLIGQTYNPWTMFADQVYGSDNDLIGFGALYDSRQPQIKITLDNGLYITLVKTNDGSDLVAGSVQYNQIPKIGVGYNGKAGNTTFGAGFAYNTYKEKNDAANWDEDVNSFLIYARATVSVGAVTAKTQVHYGQNLKNFGISGRPNGAATLNATGGIDNTDGWGGFAQVGVKVSQTASVVAGAGFTRDKQADTDYDQTSVFIQAPIEIAPHFHVVPEFDYFHYNHPGASHIGVPSVGLPNLEDAYVVGAKWQFDF
jgi:hypothetical protein